MAELTVGLDIGVSSIGWAIVDEENCQIIRTGVRVFPEGVDRDQQGGEKSKNAARRIARGMRRQLARRSARRRALRACLQSAGLLPANEAECEDWLHECCPYEMRAAALKRALSPFELGRVLAHLGQRRGFLSNRKSDKKSNELKGMKAEMEGLAQRIAAAGCETLGEYLWKRNQDFANGGTTSAESPPIADTDADGWKVRGRHTRRDMLIAEFERVWEYQKQFHPLVLTDALQKQLYEPVPAGQGGNWLCCGLLFAQRAMYWPKSMIGRCEYERGEKRCPRADRAAQRFRILQEANNLRVLDQDTGEERSLEDEERRIVIQELMNAAERSFDQLRKKLGFSERVIFNLEGGTNPQTRRKKLLGHKTDSTLSSKGVLGKRWHTLAEDTKDRVVSLLLREDREDALLLALTSRCGLSSEDAERVVAVTLDDGYASLSRTAMFKLNPFLEQGMNLMDENPSKSALHAAGYLRPDEREVRTREFLPPAPDLPNPIVRQALVEVRKVMNGIVREYVKKGGHTLAHIRVELAREAKKTLEERTKLRIEQSSRRDEREQAAGEVRKVVGSSGPSRSPAGPEISPDAETPVRRRDIDKFLLWKEQREECPYCGNKIGLAQLLSDSGDLHVDHILPRWKSLDNSMMNKVVCHSVCNAGKGQQTPRQWLKDSRPEEYEKLLVRIRHLPYSKQVRFQQADARLEDFVQRQLVDTSYISRLSLHYLKSLGARVTAVRGDMTSVLRHFWGLDHVLGDGEEKNRADHRHHAVDAVIISLTDGKRLHALASSRSAPLKEKHTAPPWGTTEAFLKDVKRAVLPIVISHRVRCRIAGSLHEDTIYGATQKGPTPSRRGKPAGPSGPPGGAARPHAKGWIEETGVFVRRKPVTSLTNMKHLEKVRDPSIRTALIEHVQRITGEHPMPKAGSQGRRGKAKEFPKDVFKGIHTPRLPSGVPIRSVRMLEKSETFRAVSERRAFQFVKPGSNHHIVIGERIVKGQTIWEGEVVTMWDAARRARRGEATVQRKMDHGARFVMSLSINEAFEMDDGDNGRVVCVVRMLDQLKKRVHYKYHHDARPGGEIKGDNLYVTVEGLRERGAKKVMVDPLGTLRWADRAQGDRSDASGVDPAVRKLAEQIVGTALSNTKAWKLLKSNPALKSKGAALGAAIRAVRGEH